MGHVGPCEDEEEPPAAVAVAVLQRRAGIMFSGNTGAVVSSEEGLATSAPSYGLMKDVVKVVEALPAALFDRLAELRPCGLLDKYGAQGMLIGDVLGLPLMPWVLAEPVGKAAAKLPKPSSSSRRCGTGMRCGDCSAHILVSCVASRRTLRVRWCTGPFAWRPSPVPSLQPAPQRARLGSTSTQLSRIHATSWRWREIGVKVVIYVYVRSHSDSCIDIQHK